MKKKSTILALIGVICFALALYFMYKETRDEYEDLETEPQPIKKTVKNDTKGKVTKTETGTEPVIPAVTDPADEPGTK